MSRAHLFWMLFLVLAVLASSVGVVYAKYQSRALFVDLQKARNSSDKAFSEWGRLQLELATEGGLDDVVRVAGSRLKMHAPDAAHVVVVE